MNKKPTVLALGSGFAEQDYALALERNTVLPNLPFAHLNLTRNPFGELSLEERGTLVVSRLECFVPSLRQPCFALQVLGKCGRGKTSHLLSLRRHFPTAPYVHYPEDGPRPHVPQAPLLFLDETQRYKSRDLKNILKQNASFVIGTHQDHTNLFKTLGLKHYTLHLKGLKPEHLAEILRRRLEASRRGSGPIPTLETDVIHRLIHSFGDDIRAIEAYLYEIFQGLETVGAVKLDTIN